MDHITVELKKSINANKQKKNLYKSMNLIIKVVHLDCTQTHNNERNNGETDVFFFLQAKYSSDVENLKALEIHSCTVPLENVKQWLVKHSLKSNSSPTRSGQRPRGLFIAIKMACVIFTTI